MGKWLVAMRRKDWHPTPSQRICEKHFLPSDYSYPSCLPNYQSLGKKYLKKDAVPSVFDFPAHIQKKETKERKPRKRPSASPNRLTTSTEKKPKLADDHTYVLKTSPRKVAEKYKRKLQEKNKIIKKLRISNVRKEKTIKGLCSQLKELKMLSQTSEETLAENFGHLTTELFRNETKNALKQAGSRYSREIKKFAISLHFYSPRAYRFIRKHLH